MLGTNSTISDHSHRLLRVCASSQNKSPIRNQPTTNNDPPQILIKDIIIQIHKLKPSHEVRDAPDRSAPFRPRDCVADFRVQVEPDGRGGVFERSRRNGRVGEGEVLVYVVGGVEEAVQHVGGRDQVAEGLELDPDGRVGDGVDVRLRWEGAGGRFVISTWV